MVHILDNSSHIDSELRTDRHKRIDFLVTAARAALAMAFASYRLWHAKRRSRRRLAELDECMLRDIGITRGEADSEIGKSFHLRHPVGLSHDVWC